MKRVLVLAGLVTAAVLAPATAAHADHVCVTSGGQPVYCTPHVTIVQPERICVTIGGSPVVCVF